ncbi:MAG: hypothetical protein ACXABY_32075 [Candidatus Thorarchaeota archaeon]
MNIYTIGRHGWELVNLVSVPLVIYIAYLASCHYDDAAEKKDDFRELVENWNNEEDLFL